MGNKSLTAETMNFGRFYSCKWYGYNRDTEQSDSFIDWHNGYVTKVVFPLNPSGYVLYIMLSPWPKISEHALLTPVSSLCVKDIREEL